MKFRVFILFLFLISQIKAANILAIWPVVSRTHFTLGMTLFEKLAENGHTVTLVSPFDQRESHENIKLVKLAGTTEAAMHGNRTSFLELKDLSILQTLNERVKNGAAMAEFTIQHDKLLNVLGSGEKFDLFIYDAYYNDALLAIAYFQKIPAIAFSCVGPNQQTNKMTRNPVNPAYDVNMLLGLSDTMSYMNRVRNTAVTLVELFHYYFIYIPQQNKLLKDNFNDLEDQKVPNILDLINNVNLVFINSHPLIQPSRVHPPNSIEVGGMQLRTQNKEIHQDLTNIMNKAMYGIIYVSLGGNVRSIDLPKEKLDIFINVFTYLNSKDIVVLWKYEGIDLKERQPHSTVIGPWMPQQEILAHKNLRAFITLGGLLSLMEAVHYAKPVIGIPIFNDQKHNMARVTSQGYGIQLDYDNLSEDMLRMAIDKIFNDTTYRDNAEKLSEHIKDSPIKAIDKAAWYVEHVIKTNGAKHLRTKATLLSFWKIHFIDQILMALTFITSVIITLLSIMKYSKVKFQKRRKSPQHTIKGKAATSVRKNKFKSN
ncbi:unnamed protein product [Chironomus riparius]|uniref:UDP-glucuronosyltransferase n=1 Tax=Chironomus riparius TaxID=315576 RepID=A0A9N9RZY3_9DIPT|nr:unnamed protein product [Chironomus riparius]